MTNLIEIVLMLLLPTAFIRAYGRMVGDRRQGWALLVIAGILFVGALAVTSTAQAMHHNTVPAAVGAASEGTETGSVSRAAHCSVSRQRAPPTAPPIPATTVSPASAVAC